MAKYEVNYKALEDVDTSVLIDVVARYMNVARYPDIDVVLTILGIEEVKECVGTDASNAELI